MNIRNWVNMDNVFSRRGKYLSINGTDPQLFSPLVGELIEISNIKRVSLERRDKIRIMLYSGDDIKFIFFNDLAPEAFEHLSYLIGGLTEREIFKQRSGSESLKDLFDGTAFDDD